MGGHAWWVLEGAGAAHPVVLEEACVVGRRQLPGESPAGPGQDAVRARAPRRVPGALEWDLVWKPGSSYNEAIPDGQAPTHDWCLQEKGETFGARGRGPVNMETE